MTRGYDHCQEPRSISCFSTPIMSGRRSSCQLQYKTSHLRPLHATSHMTKSIPFGKNTTVQLKSLQALRITKGYVPLKVLVNQNRTFHPKPLQAVFHIEVQIQHTVFHHSHPQATSKIKVLNQYKIFHLEDISCNKE